MRTFLQMLGQSVALSTILLSSAVNAQNAPVAAPAGGTVDISINSGINLADLDPALYDHSDPFVRVHIVDAQGAKTFIYNTATSFETHDPEWGEGRGGVFLPASGILEFEVRDSDTQNWNDPDGRSENIGWVKIDIATLLAPGSNLIGQHLHTITAADGTTAVQGQLNLTISPVLFYGGSVIRIIRGSGLPDSLSTWYPDPDPYAIVNRINADGSKIHLFSTESESQTKEPEWTVAGHKAQRADVFLPMTGQLEFVIRDDNYFSYSPMGNFSIDIAQIAAGSPSVIGTHVYPLSTAGNVTVEISAEEKPAVVNIYVRRGFKLRDVDNTTQTVNGTESDPFVNVYVDVNSSSGGVEKTWMYTTQAIQNTRNPSWKEVQGQVGGVVLPHTARTGATLEFEVLDEDGWETNRHHMGWVKIDMAKILARDPSVIGTHTYPVSYEDGTIPDPNAEPLTVEVCENTCFWDNDSECDDGGPGHQYDVCQFGTDCLDCGLRTESNIGVALGMLEIVIEPVAFFQPCGSGKYFVSTSMACIDCAQGSTPVAVSGADATTCRCDSATQTWNAESNVCENMPTEAPSAENTRELNNASSDGSSKCEWWCWLLVALGALSLCGLLAFCVMRRRTAKRDDQKEDFGERDVVGQLQLVEQEADQGAQKEGMLHVPPNEEVADPSDAADL